MLSHIVRGFRFGSLLSLSLLAAGWAVPAIAQVKLEHKFVDGRKTVMHTTMKVKQTLTLAGMAQETESERFSISTDQAGKRGADGKLRIEKRTDKLSVNLKIQGIEVTFDSDDPNKKAENPLLEPLVQVLRASAKVKPVLVRVRRARWSPSKEWTSWRKKSRKQFVAMPIQRKSRRPRIKSWRHFPARPSSQRHLVEEFRDVTRWRPDHESDDRLQVHR